MLWFCRDELASTLQLFDPERRRSSFSPRRTSGASTVSGPYYLWRLCILCLILHTYSFYYTNKYIFYYSLTQKDYYSRVGISSITQGNRQVVYYTQTHRFKHSWTDPVTHQHIQVLLFMDTQVLILTDKDRSYYSQTHVQSLVDSDRCYYSWTQTDSVTHGHRQVLLFTVTDKFCYSWTQDRSCYSQTHKFNHSWTQTGAIIHGHSQVLLFTVIDKLCYSWT